MDYSFSDISLFNRCRFSYQAQKVWNWQRSGATQPMLLGTLVHQGLNAEFWKGDIQTAIMLAGDEHYQNYGDIDLATLNQLEKHAYRLTNESLKKLNDFEPIYDHHGLPMSEFRINRPLNDDDNFVGIIDLVAREKSTGMIWLFDYKVRETLQTPDTEDYNLQMAIYQYLLMQIGIPVVGSIMFQIRSSERKSPSQNKDGSMSRADVVCDWLHYELCLQQVGLNPLDYLDMKTKLDAKEFFRFSKDYRDPNYLARIWSEVVLPTIEALRETLGGKVALRNLNSMCKTCSINERCNNHLRGFEDIPKIEVEIATDTY